MAWTLHNDHLTDQSNCSISDNSMHCAYQNIIVFLVILKNNEVTGKTGFSIMLVRFLYYCACPVKTREKRGIKIKLCVSVSFYWLGLLRMQRNSISTPKPFSILFNNSYCALMDGNITVATKPYLCSCVLATNPAVTKTSKFLFLTISCILHNETIMQLVFSVIYFLFSISTG